MRPPRDVRLWKHAVFVFVAAIAANVIYFGSSDGWVHAIDGKDGKHSRVSDGRIEGQCVEVY